MAVRQVLQIGNPLLREPAREVATSELGSAALRLLVEDLVDTMQSAGGIGIAAPQIGMPVRAAVIEIDAASDRYPSSHAFPRLVMINPRITVVAEAEQGFWEGCLSVPNLRGLVFRPRRVHVDYFDIDGGAHTLDAEGFLATVFQHELDHLDGVLFVDRVKDTTRLATVENYLRYWLETTEDPAEI